MLHIAICDNSGEDSQETRRLVEQALGGYTVRYNIQVFESGEELLVSSVLFDLIFMEAALEGEDGIEIGKKLYCRNRATKIIFQSYSNQCCEDAMNKTHAFAFLEKPVKKETLEEQIRDFLTAWGVCRIPGSLLCSPVRRLWKMRDRWSDCRWGIFFTLNVRRMAGPSRR